MDAVVWEQIVYKMKEYFSHDYFARSDTKMQNLWSSMGLEGIGLYWCLVEKMYESNGFIMRTHCDGIAFEMRTSCEKIERILSSDLFENDAEKYWSNSILRRLKERTSKSDVARKNAEIRWKSKEKCESNATALRTTCESNAIKEKKKKGKEIKYSCSFLEFWEQYPKKVGKDKAWESWERKSPPIDDVLRSLSWQKTSAQWTRDGGQFVPHPTTWINQGRWTDEPQSQAIPKQHQPEMFDDTEPETESYE